MRREGRPTAWSPAGDTIAFIAKREQQGKKDEAAAALRDRARRRRGAPRRRVATGIEAFKWFPDGKRIAFVAWVWPELKGEAAQAKRHKAFKDRKESGYATSEALYRYWDHSLPMGRVPQLHVLDVASGRIRDLFEGSGYELSRAEPDTNAFDISPDGRRIVFAFDPGRREAPRQLQRARRDRLAERQVATHRARQGWDCHAPRYSPDGTRSLSSPRTRARKHTMPPPARGVGRASGRWTRVSAEWDHEVHAPLRWADDASALLFTAEQTGPPPSVALRAADRRAEVIVPAAG